jgi:methylated-DNA-[protein]-cysteine S-methyltransferase
MTLAAHDSALLWVGFDGQKHQPDLCAWPLSNAHPVLQGACTQLQQYFASERRTFDLPCDVSAGTPFQQRVWHSLQSIASGSTRSYASIALASGQPRAVRAVGGAIGRNPISIIIPCHRVVGSNGTLTGYAGGIDRKIALLQLESPI